MLTTGLSAFALVRFGLGHSGGFFSMLILLVVAGAIAWELMRPSPTDSSKN
jgi:hypothetical protein